QSLAGPVRGDEILQHGQAFAEIGCDRRLDDLPDGFAISPRMPPNWRICWELPRAPESAIIKMGLKAASARASPPAPSSFIISLATCSVTWAQMSMTLL